MITLCKLRATIGLFFITSIIYSHAQGNEIEALMKALQTNPDKFEQIELNDINQVVDFEIQLGESTTQLPDGDKLDGFRFKAPEGSDTTDFVWYFNAPSDWSNWYLCPMEGEFERNFGSWLEADQLYKQFDRIHEKQRHRTLQTLGSGYFKPGKEYIMWFRQVGKGKGRLTGRLALKESKDKWEHDDIEKALKLKKMPLEAQVRELNSRGGKILFDKDFYDRSYAKNRIDNALFSIRRTKRLRGGLFITMEMQIPNCKTTPSITDIRKRHGEPDFIVTGEEMNKVYQAEKDSNTITYYYDYFGFEVKKDDPKGIVQRVISQANNFSDLQPKDKKPSFGQVSMKNLTTFTKDGKEVGRMYYFLEGHKQPVVITAPPIGSYKSGQLELEYKGDGVWLWRTYFDDGSLARKVSMQKHMMHGEAVGFHSPNVRSFVANYENGLLHGKVTKYSEGGEILDETIFEKGKPKKKGTL